MDYTELILTISGDILTGREISVAELAELGFESFEETTGGIRAYIQCDKFDAKAIEKLIVLNNSEFKGSSFTHSRIRTTNWNQEWEKNYNPVSVGDFCHIRALFHPSPGGFRHELIIHPKMSFGTGHHETTWLMVEAMQNIDFSNRAVLDMGCGTGVLAILASRMGASSVTAVDIDDWAVENAKENREINNAASINIRAGDINVIEKGEKYDIILANITRNILLSYLSRFAALLETGGSLLMSGFYSEDLADIKDSASAAGLAFVNSNSKNRWTMALFKK